MTRQTNPLTPECTPPADNGSAVVAHAESSSGAGTQLPVEVPESDTLWLLLTGGYSLNYVRSGLASGSPHFENEAKVLRQRAHRVWAQIRAEVSA